MTHRIRRQTVTSSARIDPRSAVAFLLMPDFRDFLLVPFLIPVVPVDFLAVMPVSVDFFFFFFFFGVPSPVVFEVDEVVFFGVSCVLPVSSGSDCAVVAPSAGFSVMPVSFDSSLPSFEGTFAAASFLSFVALALASFS